MNTKTEVKNELSLTDLFGDVISSYSQAQAIEDGFLHKLDDKIVKEAGFKYPVVITNGIAGIIERAKKNPSQSWDGIVWDILTLLKYGIGGSSNTQRVAFIVKINGKNYTLISVVGGGDEGEPVITIMLPGED